MSNGETGNRIGRTQMVHHGFPTAAACLGDAVTRLITLVDQEAHVTP